MFIVDAHCDTLSGMLIRNESFESNGLQIDLRSLKDASEEGYLQFFAVFESPSNPMKKQKEEVRSMIESFQKMTSDYGIRKVLSRDDLKGNGVKALLSLEGLYFMEGDYSLLDGLYEDGVRCISLTWNPDNEFAGGITGKTGNGLSDSGFSLVEKAMEKGMLIDVSHLSDKGFYQIAELAENYGKPFVATHSNARELCRHKRNLDNKMLRTLAACGGVTGLNVFSCFLNDDCKAGPDDIIRHIEHICGVAGPGHAGFGCDFDGIERDKSAIEGPGGISLILERLLQLNYSEKQVSDIAGGNFLRVLGEIL